MSAIDITKMKILYSQIKQLVPQLKANSREIGAALTMTGFMMDSLKKVNFKGRPDYLISFEVRQNRPDCLSVIGLAKEVAAYYGLKFMLPAVAVRYPKTGQLNIGVEAKKYVQRAFAVEIKELKNRQSPAWLKEFLSFYNINSINLLVDLSNYAMIFTGYPSHLLDKEKVTGRFFWALNNEFNEITTLDGSRIPLKKKEELLIRDEKNGLGLAGIVGGKIASLDLGTDSIIAEMAVYDRVIIRRNSRDLNVTTEASHRLGKDLDPNGLDFASQFLVSLILENCGGRMTAKPFSYYPKKYLAPKIKLNPALPSLYAGIEIPVAKTVKVLKNLNFKVSQSKNGLVVIPPENRMDVAIKEDVIEEVIRLVGYDKIPANQVPQLRIVDEITPKIIHLKEKIRDILSILGLDEILSWPLTKKEINLLVNYRNWENIATQNSVNEEYPDLRQSMATGLLFQLDEYLKKNVSHIRLFEIGKVFGKDKGRYSENESLGILIQSLGKSITELKQIIETLLRFLGFNDLRYRIVDTKPQLANPYSCWEIIIKNKAIGILYKLQPDYGKGNIYFAEMNLSELARLLESFHPNPVIELDKKLISLDANVELYEKEPLDEFLGEVKKKIGEKNIWAITVEDAFPLENNRIRYTIRISYQGLTDNEAKEKHLNAFGLERNISHNFAV